MLRRASFRSTRVVAAVTVAAIVVSIAPAYAAITRFTDVPDSNIFASDIEWMDDNGITSGCGADTFCPRDVVTREQMSAFLHRLATKQVVDAATVGGKSAADFAAVDHQHNQYAVGDHTHTEYAAADHAHDEDYLSIGGTAADSQLLDGRNAADLVRVASFSFDSKLVPDDFARLGYFDIEAPSSGFLMLSSSLSAHTSLSEELFYCGFEVDGELVVGRNITFTKSTPGILGDCHAEVVVPVTAGIHTITVLGFYSDLLNSQFQSGNASALYIPFDGEGRSPKVVADSVAPAHEEPMAGATDRVE